MILNHLNDNNIKQDLSISDFSIIYYVKFKIINNFP